MPNLGIFQKCDFSHLKLKQAKHSQILRARTIHLYSFFFFISFLLCQRGLRRVEAYLRVPRSYCLLEGITDVFLLLRHSIYCLLSIGHH